MLAKNLRRNVSIGVNFTEDLKPSHITQTIPRIL
jgi:hypothetical protein